MFAESFLAGVKIGLESAEKHPVETLPPPSRPAQETTGDDPIGAGATGRDAGRAEPMDAHHAASISARMASAANAVVAGKPDVIETAIATLLAGGHLLIEDIPGVGKTLLAQVISRSLGGSFRRIQGTSDLLPGDVTGSMMPDADGTSMTFRPGPVFANVVMFDELNRTTPRTQSALLELTEESTVSVDGVSHHLPTPFMLVATQNPIDIAGTYGLGEGSLDRFAAVVTPGRATPESELEVLAGRQGRSMLDAVEPVATLDEMQQLRDYVTTVYLAEELASYVVAILGATRAHPGIRLGASTRGGVALISLARARAVLHGRGYVVPDDIASMAQAALSHRVIPTDPAGSTTVGRALVAECLASVAPPTV